MANQDIQNTGETNTANSSTGRKSKAQKRQMRQEALQKQTLVRRSTLYLSVGLALVIGLYMGTLLQGFTNTGVSTTGDTTDTTSHIAELEAAVKNTPADVDAWIHLANVYYDANMPQKAVDAYEAALNINPNNPNVLTDCGTMYRKLRKFDMALERYYTAQRIDPTHKNSFFNAGIVLYYDLGKKAEGKKMFEKVLSIDPNAVAPNGRDLKELLREL